MVTNKNKEALEEMGYLLYNQNENGTLSILEIQTIFNLRKAKIKNKNMSQSKIYKIADKHNIVYIESLDKWYYNNKPYSTNVIEKEIFNSPDEIIDYYNTNEDINTENSDNELDENLKFYGYLLFNHTNYNKIIAQEYTSKHSIENDEKSSRKSHISKIYTHKDYENIKFIKKINKWYYNSKKFSIIDLNLKLYDSYEEIIKEENSPTEEIYITKNDINEDTNLNFKVKNMRRLNEKSYLKDLKFKGYILLEFNSKDIIDYKIFDKYKLAKEHETDTNQIYKCFSKRNDVNIVYIKKIKRWLNLNDENHRLYDKENKLPITKIDKKEKYENVQSDLKKEQTNSFKDIVKNRKLILKGWIYYEKNNDNVILARVYKSSNRLLNRLENSNGSSSQLFRCKNDEKIFYIKELDKWFNNEKNMENKDSIVKILDENEIFE